MLLEAEGCSEQSEEAKSEIMKKRVCMKEELRKQMITTALLMMACAAAVTAQEAKSNPLAPMNTLRRDTTMMRTAPHLSVAVSISKDLLKRAAQYEPFMIAAGRSYGVDPRLLWTIAFLETRFQTGLVSPKGARGLMQFMPETAHRWRINPDHPVQAIEGAARYLRQLLDRFGGDVAAALASYNAGEGAVDAYRRGVRMRTSAGQVINPRGIRTPDGLPPYRETQRYVAEARVLWRTLNHSALDSSSLPTWRTALLDRMPLRQEVPRSSASGLQANNTRRVAFALSAASLYYTPSAESAGPVRSSAPPEGRTRSLYLSEEK